MALHRENEPYRARGAQGTVSQRNAPVGHRPDMLTRALAYATAGTPVFPCVVGGKAPLTTHGFHDATTDVATIRTWWSANPDANIATPTGAPGFDVLDIDVRPDGTGWAALNHAKAAGLTQGWIRAVATPSGGLHLHYPGTDQRSGSIRGAHLDFRGAGGYVLLPPSLGQTKTYSNRYDVIATQEPPGRPLDWAALTHLLTPSPAHRPDRAPSRAAHGADPTPWLAAHVAKQPEGNRDNALFWAACRAAEAGVTDYEPLVAAAVSAGLPEKQAVRTVISARDTVARGAPGRASPAAPAVPAHPSLSR